MNTLHLSRAIEKYIKAKRTRGFSENTIAAYSQTFLQFQSFLSEDLDINSIDEDTIMDFLASRNHVGQKTKLNHHTGLSSLWAYLHQNKIVEKNIMKDVERPNPEKRQIIPFSQEDIKSILLETEKGELGYRNKTIIFVLLDTGLRASEITNIKIRHIDFKNKRIEIFGKGNKERIVPISRSTIKAIKITIQKKGFDPIKDKNQYLFTTKEDKKITRDRLLKLLVTIADRANIYTGNPHRYRHTFAIQFLRNGGNIFSLQKILGHTTLDMVKKYLAIAQSDIEKDHQIASPVESWRLGK